MTTLREAILNEPPARQRGMIAGYIRTQERFDDLIELFLTNEYRLTQRAAWLLSYCGQKHPLLVQKHLERIILNLKNDVPVAVKRNTVRVLQYVDIPEELQGVATEICFDYLNSEKEPVAVKVFSMTVLTNICKKQPDLAHELKLSIEAQLAFASSGFRARARKELKRLTKDKKGARNRGIKE